MILSIEEHGHHFFGLDVWIDLQPVLHQQVYHGVFTEVSTDLQCFFFFLLLFFFFLFFFFLFLFFFFVFCGAGGYPPNVLQPTEAYCTNPALVSPLHLQRRSISDDVRGLY
jgi:hypothetical protein